MAKKFSTTLKETVYKFFKENPNVTNQEALDKLATIGVDSEGLNIKSISDWARRGNWRTGGGVEPFKGGGKGGKGKKAPFVLSGGFVEFTKEEKGLIAKLLQSNLNSLEKRKKNGWTLLFKAGRLSVEERINRTKTALDKIKSLG